MKNILKEKASRIKLLITDCDGVLTDGGVYYSETGEELKKFNMQDGMGVERLRKVAGIETAVITGEASPSLIKRAQKLQITELHLLAKDKSAVLTEMMLRLEIKGDEIAYIGDDYNDRAIMKMVGLTASPANGLPAIKAIADYVCENRGGEGCFREFAELIIACKEEDVEPTERTLSNGRKIGRGQPCYIIAEIGINHNGSLDITKKLIDEAVAAKADAVKFQKRTPEICVPKDQWEVMRDTPWGRMSYIDYKRKTEFGIAEYATIDQYCKKAGIDWFVSAWDVPSVDFMEQFDTVMYKLASASLTDFELIERILETGRPLMLSTGMSNHARD